MTVELVRGVPLVPQKQAKILHWGAKFKWDISPAPKGNPFGEPSRVE
jgi:hypothetical protein